MGKKNRRNEQAAEKYPDAPVLAPAGLPAMAGVAECAKEDRRPSRMERRAKLIAAHVAIDAIRYEIDDWRHREGLQTVIAAALGRLELAAALGRLELRE